MEIEPTRYIRTFPVQGPWKPWFAWYPVKLIEGNWAWLRTVSRARGWFHPFSPRSYDYAEPFHVALYGKTITPFETT